MKENSQSSGVPEVSWRVQAPVYGCGMFSHSLNNMATVILPLWVISLGATPLEAGIALGCRYLLLTFFSIHSGAMMDRIGTRRVIILFGCAAIILNSAYPFFPSLAAVIVIQLFAGWAGSMGWLGSQTMIGQFMGGSPVYAGRLSASLRVAAIVGPPSIGAIWDHFGAFFAFSFLACWACLPVISAMMLPTTSRGRASSSPKMRQLVPNWRDYKEALSLIAVPAIVLVLTITVMRYAGISVQHSFYVVWLNEIGLTGTKIGFLLTIWAIAGGFSALCVGTLLRVISDRWLALLMVATQITLLSITPLLPNYTALLVAMAFYGASMGISQPVLIGLMARATPSKHQGKSAGLRATANQCSGVFLPITMGAIAEWIGLESAFYIVGISLLLVILGIAITIQKTGFGSK